MTSGTHSNIVYFSSLLPERCPKTFRGLEEVLSRYGVELRFLQGTKDIWVRDYMPIPVFPGHLVGFTYNPDYLRNDPKYRDTITDGNEVARAAGISFSSGLSGIVLDGGNFIRCGGKFIMTSKVFEENPWAQVSYLSRFLEAHLCGQLVVLPWDSNETYGHADGICRMVDNDTVLMTNYCQLDRKMAARFRNILEHNFKKVRELHFDVPKLDKKSWAYINWLQTEEVLILPKFNIPEDDQAFRQISRLMPSYKGRIEMVDTSDLIRYEGCLNCCSWVVEDCEDLQEVPVRL